MVLAEYKPKRQKLMTIPCTAQTDKKLKYVRYADDFLIAVKGNREDCQWIKSKLAEFIGDTLKMELSEDKTLQRRWKPLPGAAQQPRRCR